MVRENTICLFCLFLCYSEFIRGMSSGCKSDAECILLKECKSLMNFVGFFEKPLKPSVVEFLRKKHCGFEEGSPKICCSNSSVDVAVILQRAHFKSCNTEDDCIPLKSCQPYMQLIEEMGKPLEPVFVEFLRAQQCGFQQDYPTVCCSLLPKNLKLLRRAKTDSSLHLFKTHNKFSSTDPDLSATAKPPEPIRSGNIEEKIEAINKKFDADDFFDFTGTFDLLRRRRFTNDLDIQIR